MNHKTNSEVLEKILQYYNDGAKVSDIVKFTGSSKSVVYRCVRNSDLPRRSNHTNGGYSPGQIDNILSLYISGKSIDYICKKFKHDSYSVKKLLESRNIQLRGIRKNLFNEDFFKDIESEKQAYWLGFIMADGSVCQTSRSCTRVNRLHINISQKDRCLLEKFILDIDAVNVIIDDYIPKGTYSTNPMCRMYLNSVSMCDDLAIHGISSRKTGKEQIPNTVPDHLIRHFIRGFFDGDGSVSRSSSCTINFSITSNEMMNLQIQEILIRECNLRKTKLTEYPHKNNCVCDLRYGGRIQVARIYHYLYDDATIYLDRKKQKFNLIISD